jgi:magnesium transporter
VDLAPPPEGDQDAGQFWTDFITETAPEFRRPTIEQLDTFVRPVWESLIEGARYCEPQLRRILDEKREVASLRRIITPQRDVIARLARRDFVDISTEMSFRFRDIYDHLVRIADDAMIFQDRITGMLDAHLSNVSNRLNEVMKVLTVVATIFMPPTVLVGAWGMNVPLPHLPGGDAAQFWWVSGGCIAMVIGMLGFFRRKRWI